MNLPFHLLLTLAACFLWGGCGDSQSVRVELLVGPSREPDPRRLIVRAQVTGAQDQLIYRWFSQTGECIPQRTESPATTFRFGDGQTKDRVVVEVWRGARQVGRSEVVVDFAGTPTPAPRTKPKVQIEMTDTPPYNPLGGPATRAHIGGNITGEFDSAVVVVIYARANDVWYVQPDPQSAKHLLRSDRSFSTWTHTGSDYAILVARPTFTPLAAAEFLPLVESDILAHLIVEGERK